MQYAASKISEFFPLIAKRKRGWKEKKKGGWPEEWEENEISIFSKGVFL